MSNIIIAFIGVFLIAAVGEWFDRRAVRDFRRRLGLHDPDRDPTSEDDPDLPPR